MLEIQFAYTSMILLMLFTKVTYAKSNAISRYQRVNNQQGHLEKREDPLEVFTVLL